MITEFSVSKTNSLLFKQTKEDREKRITEKVAMILIDVDTSASSSKLLGNDCPNTKLVSKYLNSIRNTVSVIFNVLKVLIKSYFVNICFKHFY